MPYRSDTVVNIVGRLNVQYFLPAIQREFVWGIDQTVLLFDSIMQGYPISSFLFWELQPENYEKWEIYGFVSHVKQGGTHNALASPHGVERLTLVLDGQQRLTSLLLGLKGSYTVKKKHKHHASPDAWSKQVLYLNLLRDPHVEAEVGPRYGFAFFDGPPENGAGRHWFKVGRILDQASQDVETLCSFEADKLPAGSGDDERALLRRNLARLHEAFRSEPIVSYFIETSQEYDRVLEIFVRANEGGTKLSKSDLLLSMVTTHWNGANAREEIFTFVDRLNLGLARKNGFDKDFVLKTCLVVSDLPVQYKVDNFTVKNLALIQSKWNGIKRAIEATVNLVNGFGLDRDNLTSANALIPIAYYLHRHPGLTLGGSTPFAVRTATAIRSWLTMALLNGLFGGQSDSVLRDIRHFLQSRPADDREFPIDELNRTIARQGRRARFDEEAIEHFLSISYGKQTTFLALSLLYDDNNWGTTIHHVDHIFPQALFTDRALADAGVPREDWRTLQTLANRVGNLQLLMGVENQQKSDKPFREWLKTRDSGFRRRHLIPSDETIYEVTRFESFIDAREALIRQRLKGLFAEPTASEVGSAVATVPSSAAETGEPSLAYDEGPNRRDVAGMSPAMLSDLRRRFGNDPAQQALYHALLLGLQRSGFNAKVNTDAVAVSVPGGATVAFYLKPLKRSGTVSVNVNPRDPRLPGILARRAATRLQDGYHCFEVATPAAIGEILTLLQADAREVGVEDMIRAVGMACFVNCYRDFEQEHMGRTNRDATKHAMHQRGGAVSENAAASKAYSGVRIFRHGFQEAALKMIIDSRNTPQEVREQARALWLGVRA